MGRRVKVRALAAIALVACGSGGGKARPADDAARPRDGSPTAPPADGSATAPGGARLGDVQVRVEWKDVPVAARASPGRTACKTPRSPAVAPTTLWGIPDVLVFVDGAPADASEARVVLAECTLAPRVSAGSALVVASGVEQPATITLAPRGTAAALPAVSPGAPLVVQLPIAGHAVAPAIAAGAIYELAAGTETAWFVAATAAVTDASGTVLVRDVPIGTHAVSAWLPPRAGQPARHVRGEVTVEADDLAELTLQLE